MIESPRSSTGRSGHDRRERLADALALRRRDHPARAPRRTADPARPRRCTASDRRRARRLDGSTSVAVKRPAADCDEVVGVGCRLGLQDPVDGADQLDQVVHRRVARLGRELRVLARPLQLVEDRVLRLLLQWYRKTSFHSSERSASVSMLSR